MQPRPSITGGYKMLSSLKTGFLFLLCVAFSSWSQAEGVDFMLGVEASTFDYKEKDSDGNTLNKESGALPGLFLGVENPSKEGFWAQGILSFYGATVDYEGRTQSGSPLATDTNESFLSGRMRLFYTLPGMLLRYSPFLGLGYTEWGRSIQPTETTLRLNEEYRWFEPEVGLVVRPVAERWTFIFARFSVYQVHSGRVMIDLDQLGFGEPELNLGQKTGRRLSVGATWKARQQFYLRASLFMDYYQFGASESATIQSGTRIISIREPASKTYRRGAKLTLLF